MKIVTYPASILREEARPVDQIDSETEKIIDDMFDTMYLNDGAGLAAPQVGISKRIIVVDDGNKPIHMINPEIISRSDEEENMEEGCLSLPGIRLSVWRNYKIVVCGKDKSGSVIEVEAEGLLARIFQHEIDHLNGILIIDHASSIQRRMLDSKLRKMIRAHQ